MFFKKEKSKQQEKGDFYLGVQKIFRIENSADLLAAGKVNGTIYKGAAIYITNPGEDSELTELTTVTEIIINNNSVDNAADTFVIVKLEAGSKLQLKPGSVLFTRNVSVKNVHDAYIYALGESYISTKKMELTDIDYDNMSLTDLVELRRLFCWLIEQKKTQETEEIKSFNKKTLDTISHHMCSRILSSQEIYTVIHKKTGEPFMMAQVIKQPDRYLTTPPDIMLIPKAYIDVIKNQYNPDVFDIVKIENGSDKKGIYNFLGSTFYLNGACGVKVIYDNFSIDACMLVEKPDYSNLPPIQRPVTNPDVERWLLLLGQMNEPKTDDEKLIYNIFYGHLFRELASANFIIPMKMNAKMAPPDENGKTVITEGSTMEFPTKNGKNGRDAVCMFTDWKRLRMNYKESDGWDGLIQPISGMIEKFDCAINATEYLSAGCYIDKDFYDANIK